MTERKNTPSNANISNIEKYRQDFERLRSMCFEIVTDYDYRNDEEALQGRLREHFPDDEAREKYNKSRARFSKDYQIWYSESVALIRQLLPDRLTDFTRLYERPKAIRKSIDFDNYVIEDALKGLIVTSPLRGEVVGPNSVRSLLKQQQMILDAVERRFESSLFDIRQLVQADVLDSEIDAARELNKNGFARAAGAVAGVVLEAHLLQVCENHGIAFRKKSPSISFLNEKLKSSDVLDTPAWRNIQFLGDLRNLCDHKKKDEPNCSDIDKLIEGVAEVIKTLF